MIYSLWGEKYASPALMKRFESVSCTGSVNISLLFEAEGSTPDCRVVDANACGTTREKIVIKHTAPQGREPVQTCLTLSIRKITTKNPFHVLLVTMNTTSYPGKRQRRPGGMFRSFAAAWGGPWLA